MEPPALPQSIKCIDQDYEIADCKKRITVLEGLVRQLMEAPSPNRAKNDSNLQDSGATEKLPKESEPPLAQYSSNRYIKSVQRQMASLQKSHSEWIKTTEQKITTLENLVTRVINSTTISPATSAPKDDISPATNQDSPTILPETTDPTSNESPTVASAITALQVKSKEFESVISALNEDLAQDRSTRKKTLEEMQHVKTNTGRVFSSQREMRKTIENTDQKLSKTCTEIDYICKTVYGGYKFGDKIPEVLFLSLPKAEVNSLRELRVKGMHVPMLSWLKILQTMVILN